MRNIFPLHHRGKNNFVRQYRQEIAQLFADLRCSAVAAPKWPPMNMDVLHPRKQSQRIETIVYLAQARAKRSETQLT